MVGLCLTALPAAATCNPKLIPTCGACETLTCIQGDNAWDCLPKAAGIACNDGDSCTINDVCDGNGNCGGTAGPCPPPAFNPVQCPVCPAMTEVNWTYAVGGRTNVFEQPSDPNCVPTPTSPCPHYINNVSFAVREIVASAYVSQFGFRADFFKTASSSDALSWEFWLNQSPVFSSAWRLSGTPATGWVDTAGPAALQAAPMIMTLATDGSATDEGFSLGRGRVCCSTTPTSTPAIEYRRATPFHGLLLGTNDVVYIQAKSWGQVYHSSLTLEGDQTPGNQYDLFVRCNAQPTPTAYDFVAFAPGTQQHIHLPLNYCSLGQLQIAVSSVAGSGSFKLMVTDHFASEHYRLKVGSDYAIAPGDVPSWTSTLSLGAQSFFGVTKGTQYVEGFDMWNGLGCGNCGGTSCDICIRNLPGTGQCCNAAGQIELYQDYKFQPRGIAHEFGHRQLHSNIPDEYVLAPNCPNGLSQCYRDGHTVMATPFGTNHNLCQVNDHNLDGTPGVGSASNELTSDWEKYSQSGFTPYELVETGYQSDYQDFNFRGQLGAVVLH